MIKINGKTVLWNNVLTLMKMKYGKENLGKLATDAGIGPATMTRIKEQKTSIGTETLDQIAAALKVEAWQLLCPDYDFEGPAAAAPAKPKGSGKDLAYLFDMIPLDFPAREVAYNTCFDTLLMANRRAANLPTADTAPVQSQEIRSVEHR